MPLPIQSLNNWNDDNNDKVSMETLGLSDIQLMLLGGSTNTKEAKITVSQKHIDLLKIIEQNQDDIVTAANVVNNIRDAKTFVVPKNIDDNSLLALKTAGLISGHGRSVTLTDRGRVALRDAYLKDPVNEFRKARKKDKFDLNAAKEVKVANKKSKFTKTWLTDDFDGKFSVRFVADNQETLSKGLMHADPLEDFETAFFIFPEIGNYSFWNKNVSFPLTLAFLDNNFKIVDFKSMEAEQTRSVYPNSNNVKYVVEANKDTFKNLDIEIGDFLIHKGNDLVLRKSKQ